MIQIRHLNGTLVHEMEIPEGAIVHRELMGEHYIRLHFSVGEPVYLKLGDYVQTNFGRFELTKPYAPKYNTTTDSYDYDIQLDAYYIKWKNKKCRYSPQNAASETSFHLTATVDVHLQVIANNINALGQKDSNYRYNGQEFVFQLKGFDGGNSAKYIQYQDTDIISALDSLASVYECEWWVEDNIIFFGRCEIDGDAETFEVNDNVSEMRSSESDAEYATRIYAYGSTRNIPKDYRKDSSVDVTKNGVVQKRLMLPASSCPNGYMQDSSVNTETEAVEAVLVTEDIYPRTKCKVSAVEAYTDTYKDEDTGEEVEQTFYRITDGSGFKFSNEYILEGETLHILFQSGKMNGMDFECKYNEEKKYYEVVASEDYGRILPDTSLHPEVGDEFVLYNWDATKIGNTTLITAAEKELETFIRKRFERMKIDPNTYTCKMDSYWYDESRRLDEKSFAHYSMGQKVELVNAQSFDKPRKSRIIGYEIKLDIEYDTPEYIVGEATAYSMRSDLQNQIDSITVNGSSYTGGNGGTGGGRYLYVITTTSSAVENDTNVYSAARVKKQYADRINDEKISALWTLLKGLVSKGDVKIGDFVSGHFGQGAKIDKKGDAEVQNLRVWKSMTVTELRFDRASVLLGTNIQTYCGGVIKKVEITGENSGFIDLETDEEANGEIEGGIGSVQNGALCVGYYHDIKGGNDTDDADDFKGTIKYKGTKCVQFAIDWKEEGETGYSPADLPNATTTRHIRYELREGTTQHPVEGMTFKGTGNMKDPSLGYFAISTPKYTAKYAFVTSWEWDAAQCIVEVGGADISGFGSIVGENWTSPQPGTICTNLYTRGVITQASSDKRYLYVTQDSNGMLKPGESEKITMVVRDSYFHNRTQEFSFKLNGETVENLGEEAVAHVSFEELDDEVSEFVITATDGKKHLVEQTIKIRKLLDGLRLDAGKAAIGEELTASVLRYHGTTRVTNGYLWYEIDNGGLVAYTEGSEVRLASTNKSITFFWYEDEMRLKLIAKLELPLVKNGEDGKDGADGESAYVIITDREVVKPDEESTLVYFDGFKAAVQWDGGAPVGVTNESIVVRACRCRGNKESNEGSFIYRLGGGEAHAMTNGGSVTVEKKSGIKSVTFCWMADNGAMLAQKIVYVVLDGEAPVFADLDNEMDSIVTDKDGKFEGSVTLSTNVAMYHGLTKLSPTITAATATGITSKVDGGRVSFTVTQAAADRNEMDITLSAVIEDVSYTRHLTFTIVKQRKGNTGDPAVVYSLAPSYSAIKVDKYGNRLVKSIVCNVAKTTGKDESVLLDSLPEGMKVKWQADDNSSVSESSTIPTINVSAVKNQLVLMLDYDGTVIDRETIPVMSDGVESFKEMVFKRLSEKPSKPSGGSFASPIPTGWSDGIPSGEAQVWTSSRTFYSDNRSTADWTDPVQLSDTADFDVCYHADEAKPTLLPTSHHTEDQGNGWHNTATEKDWWMATDIKKNGVWQGWKVSRIKGEKGNSFDEAKYYFKSTPRGANTPSVSLSAGVPDGWSTNIAETHWGEKVSNDFHYWLWQVIVETVMDNVGNKTYKAQSAQMIDEYDPKKTGVAETYCANNDANNHPSGWTDLSSARANFGKNNPYLWKMEEREYSDGSKEVFYSIFEKYVENGERGKRGRMLRPCGVWSASKTYVNNDDYVDAVIHNGKFYAVKEDSDGGSVSISGANYSPDTSYWEEANMLEFVATNLFFAETAHVRNLALVNMLAGYYDSNGEWISMIEIDGDGNLIIGDRTSKKNILNINSDKIQILRSLGTGSTKLDLSPSGVAATNGEVGFSLSGSLLQLYNGENPYVGIDHQGIHRSGTVTLWSEIANAVNSVKVKLIDSLPSVTEPNTLYIVK